MRDVYLFNPDNDLALAYGGDNYTAPPFARQLERDLATLPMWFATQEAMILVPDKKTQQWVNNTALQWNLDVEAITPQELASIAQARYYPWGWSVALRHKLMNRGAKVADLPSIEAIEKMRQLSHRRTSIAIHTLLSQVLHTRFSPIPQEFDTMSGVMQFARTQPGCYLKSPWSGSGRGIYHVLDASDPYLENWCRGILKRQGSILGEVGLSRTIDFAVEFHSQHGVVDVAGYSIFESDFHSQYAHGTVARNSLLHNRLTAQCPILDAVTDALKDILRAMVAPHYEGFLGIDMLLYSDDDGCIKLNPCVELNLRPTMGIVASTMDNLLAHKGGQGRFVIEHSRQGFHSQEGHIALTPIDDSTRYRAIIVPKG